MTKKENLDTRGLIEILSTLVTCTITLAELLRIKPKMWANVGECLRKFGIKNPAQKIQSNYHVFIINKKMMQAAPSKL